MYIYKYVEESYFHRCNNTHGVGMAIFYNSPQSRTTSYVIHCDGLHCKNLFPQAKIHANIPFRFTTGRTLVKRSARFSSEYTK